MKKIFVTGQCTLHWGRLEFGNIGNYYVVEPLFREILRVFPGAEIRTTFQMSDEFCEREHVVRLPMELYYGWTEKDLSIALEELAISTEYSKSSVISRKTPYIQEVLQCDLFIDFSGDIWGDNADLVGPDRFYIGLLKDRVAQLLGKKTAMIAGSPGPFENEEIKGFAREVFKGFDLITNRESMSIELLRNNGFDVSHVHSYACPAFLFEPIKEEELLNILNRDKLFLENREKIGFVICGWNMLEAPYTKWPRLDSEYIHFVELAEHILNTTDADIYFMSHSNGFELPPSFRLIHGRDYPFAQKLHKLLIERGHKGRVYLISGLYSPAETKGILGKLDALVSGRVHAAVGALAQHIPTLIIDYGHEPKAHKLKGFAEVAGVLEYVCDPADKDNLLAKFSDLWCKREKIKKHLQVRMKKVKLKSQENFTQLGLMFESK